MGPQGRSTIEASFGKQQGLTEKDRNWLNEIIKDSEDIEYLLEQGYVQKILYDYDLRKEVQDFIDDPKFKESERTAPKKILAI